MEAESSQVRVLRVVLASPGDVKAEREVLPRVLDELNRGVAADRGLRLELSRWETDAYPGFHPEGPQALIDPILRVDDCDMLVGIFWRRFGTPVKGSLSGTEHEIRKAYEAWKRTGRPHIMIYFSQRGYTPKSREETDQWGQVLEFKQNFPAEGLWWHYKGKAQFESLAREHLTQVLRNQFPAKQLASEPQLTRTALRGLTTWPRDISRVVLDYIKLHVDQRGTTIRRNLLVFETDKQRTWLSFTSAGLLCVLDNRRKGGQVSVKWFTPLDALRSAEVRTTAQGKSKGCGLLSIGQHRGWLFTKRLFQSNLPLKQIITGEIEKLP
jgi:hypothetical protein